MTADGKHHAHLCCVIWIPEAHVVDTKARPSRARPRGRDARARPLDCAGSAGPRSRARARGASMQRSGGAHPCVARARSVCVGAGAA